jgi:hypothetical protein
VLHVALAEALEEPCAPAINRWLAPSLATPASRSTSTPDWHATTLASVFGHDGPA